MTTNRTTLALGGLIALAMLTAGCSTHGSLTGPSGATAPPPIMAEMDYDINIPVPSVVAALRFEYPNNIRTSPLDAQRRWDYTTAYGGSPNVYYGESAPHCEYPHVGIVVAPRAVAGLNTFTAGDWPGIGLEPGVIYVWVGRFVYTAVAAPGTFTFDPTGQSCLNK